MDNNTKGIIKTILNFVLVLVVIEACFYALSKFTSFGSLFSNLFGSPSIDVYAFDGADKNTNGGLTRTEIDEQKQEANCPTLPDINDTLYIQDYNDFVCFYKVASDNDGNTIYPNIVFVKTDSGLKFNGALNIVGHRHYGWFGMGYSYNVEQKNNIAPVYINQSRADNGWAMTNLFLVNASESEFAITEGVSGVITAIVGSLTMTENEIRETHKYIVENIYPYFLKFYNNNVEIIQDADNPDGDFNFFYDYIYRSAKEYNYGNSTGGTCAVDVSNLTVYPLPENEKTTYPIPNTNPTQYFGVYKVNVFLTCNYTKIDQTSLYSDNDNLKKYIQDDPITYRPIDASPLCDITANLMPTSNYYNSTITNAVRDNPVIITFYDNTGTEYRQMQFNSNDFISAVGSKKSAFASGHYTYEIESNQLIFDSYSGDVDITQSSTMSFRYSYLEGKVLATFSLAPISNDVEYSDIDFANYPVRIILANEDRTQNYQFVFDALAKVNSVQSSLLPIGKYTYTILSEKLVFGNNTGSIDIVPKTRNFEFQFGVIYNRSDLAFSVVVSQTSYSSNGYFYLSGDTTSVQLLGNKLNLQNYFVTINIFDDNGNLVATLNHTHNGTGSCSDHWSTTNLIAGTRYTAQMNYTNGRDSSASGYIEYQSSTFSFDYKNSTKYTFNYSCREI